MAKNVLLEIGTEEMPVEFISSGLEQLGKLADFHFNKEKIEFRKIETYATPCRLILWVAGVNERQIAETKEIRGPAKEAAFDSQGRPTAQAVGFAKAQGIKVDDLVVKESGNKKYVCAFHETEADSSKNILKTLLPVIIKNLRFSKMMRWNNQGTFFGRPVRWLLALWGGEIIKFDFAGLKSSNFSYGHRYLSSKSFKVAGTENFFSELEKRYCLINPEERVKRIESKGKLLVEKHGGEIYVDREGLREIANLVEYPLTLLGKFSPAYLKIPEEIIVEVIGHQEKCLPVKDKKGRLLPLFVIVANRKEDQTGIIKKGYERVMEARLKDADFFYQQDLKKPLMDRVGFLKEIIFQEKLGTLFEKVERLGNLADFLGKKVNLGLAELEDLKKAGRLCKADLLTEVVKEFPNLQGSIGRHYASRDGEKERISQAIFEHYLPRFPGDFLPQSQAGALLSMVDRVDTLVGYFHLGLLPSGSEDPYSLRRQANGLLEIVIQFSFNVDLAGLIDQSAKLYGFSKTEELKKELIDFLRQRLVFILGQLGFRTDHIEAALATGGLVIAELVGKLEVLNKFGQNKEFRKMLKTYQRLHNILKSASIDKLKRQIINEDLLEEKEEKILFQHYSTSKVKLAKSGDGEEILKTLSRFTPLIDNFFDKVMVMVPEEELKVNRLLLLEAVKKLFVSFVDFSLIKREG